MAGHPSTLYCTGRLVIVCVLYHSDDYLFDIVPSFLHKLTPFHLRGSQVYDWGCDNAKQDAEADTPH